MNKLKKFYVTFGMMIFVSILMLFLLPAFPDRISAAPVLVCLGTTCAKQKSILRKLEKTRPSKKLSRNQIFNQIKAACERMRRLDCPEIRNYKPEICFTDF